MRAFRFSLQAAQAESRRDWVDTVRRTDDAGFDLLVTADHLEQCLAPLLPLATAAEVSDRLRLGIMVLNNDLHHPSMLARDVATLDLLSEGRVEVGLGAGHSEPEYRRAGIPFDPAPTRVARLEESVTALRGLLDGETVTVHGQHHHLTRETCDPRPVQAHVPILVGGGGRRVHRIAARHADAVGFTGMGRVLDDGQHAEPARFAASAVDEDVAAVRAAAGDRLRDLELQVLVQAVVVTDDARSVAAQIASTTLPSLSADDVLETPYLMVGSAAQLTEKLLAARDRWGFSHYTVRRDALGRIEPVLDALRGR